MFSYFDRIPMCDGQTDILRHRSTIAGVLISVR